MKGQETEREKKKKDGSIIKDDVIGQNPDNVSGDNDYTAETFKEK